MKKYIFLSILATAIGLGGCDRLELDDVNFNLDANSYTVKAGDALTFNFKGNPNYITFYSGEEGSTYANKDRTELSVEDVSAANLTFTLTTQYGPQTEPLKVYLGTDFTGLTQTYETDKAAVQNYKWTDITADCGLTGLNLVTNKVITYDLKNYISTGVVIAFRYIGKTGSTQKTVTITNTSIATTLKSGTIVNVGDASTFGFTPFDVTPSNSDNNAYLATGGKGTWDLKSIGSNKMALQGGTNTQPDNDDWLISNKIALNSCTPDKGTSVKDINNRMSSYTYTYAKAGTYKATFIAGNANKDDNKYIVKEVTVNVTE